MEIQKKTAIDVSVKSIVVNIALSLFKLFAGIFSGSFAMISDALHSASDVFSTFIVIIGINMAAKKSDKEHPYGHERMECVAAFLLSVALFLTGIYIGYSGIIRIFFKQNELNVPGNFALIAAVISISVKEWMYWFTVAAAKKTNSGALMADAWHHRSDAFSSVGSLIGILGAKMGFLILDPIVSVVICLFIIRVSYNIFIDTVNKIADRSCDDDTIKSMSELILAQDGVKSLDLIKTRLFGTRIYVDIEVGVNKELPFHKVHDIAEAVHDAIEEKFSNVKHCMVHVNPAD